MEVALQHFKATKPEGRLSSDAVIEAMFKVDRCRNSICNCVPRDEKGIRKIVSDVQELRNRTKSLDLQCAGSAQSRNESHTSHCRTACNVVGHQRIGTEQAVANFVGHAAKGCHSDPFPWRQMAHPKSTTPPRDEGPIELGRRRGTNSVESNNNHGTKAALGDASRQSSILTHRKTLLFVTAHNLKCDKNVEHITNVKARPRDWCAREALLKDMDPCTKHRCNDGLEFPPEFNKDRCMEPIGELCQVRRAGISLIKSSGRG